MGAQNLSETAAEGFSFTRRGFVRAISQAPSLSAVDVNCVARGRRGKKNQTKRRLFATIRGRLPVSPAPHTAAMHASRRLARFARGASRLADASANGGARRATGFPTLPPHAVRRSRPAKISQHRGRARSALLVRALERAHAELPRLDHETLVADRSYAFKRGRERERERRRERAPSLLANVRRTAHHYDRVVPGDRREWRNDVARNIRAARPGARLALGAASARREQTGRVEHSTHRAETYAHEGGRPRGDGIVRAAEGATKFFFVFADGDGVF